MRSLHVAAIDAELSPPPGESSAWRPWEGMTVQLHDWIAAGSVVSPAVDHDLVAMRLTGRVRLVQQRARTVRRMIAVPGNFTLHARECESRWSWDAPGTILVVRVPPVVLDQAAEVAHGAPRCVRLEHCFGARDPFVEPILRSYALELRRPAHALQPMIAGCLSAALAAHLVQRYDAANAAAPSEPRRLEIRGLRRVLDYVDETAPADLTLSRLATIAGVSPFQFARRFRRTMGEGLIDYLRRAGERHRPTSVRGSLSPPGALAPWQVRKATEYLHAHLERDVPLAEVAALLTLSRSHFCTAFRRTTGTSPREWTIQRRIERARALLADRRLPITEIALRLGYTPSAFGAVFRERVGVTPSAYRRRL